MVSSKKIKEILRQRRAVKPYQESDLLSTGSTLLNLALTGRIRGGFVKGRYFLFIGDSTSGKTFVSLSMLAEACLNPAFSKYRLIYDDVEGGALMDIRQFFGSLVADRLEPPKGTRDNPEYSTEVEEFYVNVDNAFEQEVPFIYVLDSQDGLDTMYAEAKFQELKDSVQKGTKRKGDYGDGKAKIHSSRLRRVCAELRDTGSILLIINQTRDNIGGGPFSPATIYSGGRALKFYACAQIWSKVSGRLETTVKGKKRQIGVRARVEVKKNRLTGKETSVDVPIYYSYGVDDIGSCVDFLVAEGHWKAVKGRITAPEFKNMRGYREPLVRAIEEKGLENELRNITQEVWHDIEAACAVKRKTRYE